MLEQSEIDAMMSNKIDINNKDVCKDQISPDACDDHIGKKEESENEKSNSKQLKVSGNLNKKENVQKYNFWSPERFSKDQVRAIELIHEDLCELLINSLPHFLHSDVDIQHVHSEQDRFQSFLDDSEEKTIFHVISLPPLPGEIILSITPDLCLKILDHLLGSMYDGETVNREITDIDRNLMRCLIEYILEDVKKAWSKIMAIVPRLDDSTDNKQWVQTIYGNNRVISVSYQITLSEKNGMMSFYIPFSTLKPIANLLHPHLWITEKKVKEPDKNLKMANLNSVQHVTLPVNVNLGSANVTFEDLLNLDVGDVIQLDTCVNQSLVMYVDDKVRFLTKVGKSGNKIAVQVVTPMLPKERDE